MSQPLQSFKTRLPPHLIRSSAHQRVAPHVPYHEWIEREWVGFMRRNGYRTRNGAAQAHFDRYMETLQA